MSLHKDKLGAREENEVFIKLPMVVKHGSVFLK
jgi:hypothetical protein